MKRFLIILSTIFFCVSLSAQSIFLEAEGFADIGGWTNDNQSSGGWMWHEGQDDMIYSIEELMDKYETSVGRNTNMLLGLVIDNRGLIPDADVKQAEKYGEAIRGRYGTPCAETSGKGAQVAVFRK